MKKHLNFAKPLVLRLALSVMLLAILCSAFVSCGGTGTTVSVTVGEIEHSEDVNSLTKLELKAISDFLASNPTAREQFVAAYRGYDMTEKDFDLTVDRPAGDPSVDAAINVLMENDSKDKLSAVPYDKMEVADMTSVINSLKQTVDLEGKRDFWSAIQYGIGVALGAITNTVGFGNYLVGICLFAIVVEILMLPFSIKQQKNSIKQAMLRPKEMAIRKKYAGRNDQATQQKIQQEIQDLYQRENFNPMGGCLPMLLQFPIIIVLYNIVVDPIRYILGFSAEASNAITTFCSAAKAAGGLGHSVTASRGTIEALSLVKEQGLSAFEGLRSFLYLENGSECYDMLQEIHASIPSFNIGSLNCGLIPSDFSNWLWWVPLLTFGVYFASMKLSRKITYQPTQANDKQQGCSNNMMDFTMPLMSVYIAFITPAVIGIYWIFRSILNTVKQFIMSKVMPLPKFTEEDYKAAEKEMKARSKGQPSRSGTARTDGTKPRSLHHIDDDDDLPAPPKKVEKKEVKEEKAEEPKDLPVDHAPLKDETDKPQKND